MYEPQLGPPGPTARWTFDELTRLSNDLKQGIIHLRILHTEPVKLRDGMIIYADGTNFNPGSGGGVYARVNGSWVKLHT